jgi:dienelactone hydrolase
LNTPRSPGRFSAALLIVHVSLHCGTVAAQQPPAPPPAAKVPLALEDLYSDFTVIDADISPSGKSIAATVRRNADDAVVVLDMGTGEKKVVTRINKDAFGKQIDVRLGNIWWKTEDRLLVQVQSRPNDDLRFDQLARGSMLKIGNRLYGVNRDGKNLIPMFGDQYEEELVGAFDTSDIASMLRNDPKHILIRVGGWEGRSLFKVDVETGRGKIVEKQRESVIDWWLNADGAAIGRVEYSLGTIRYYRKLPDGKWKKYYSVRRREMQEQADFEGIGASSDPNKFYVIARPAGKDRIGIYLYDLEKESFGEPLAENPNYDIQSASIADDGSRVMYHCYDAHVRTCDFADPKRNAYMRGLRKFFDETANVYIADASDDGNTILLFVNGPSDPPAYYYYLVDKKQIEYVGMRRNALKDKALPSATVVTYKTRDGLEQSGYLTHPPGARDAKGLPLVLMPHGGPQVRDRLEFDPWVQYLAARGYLVFQPNFRGSGGFGEAFELSGHRQWGRKMQNDLDDGVKTLVENGIVDPARICIVGASYGGYAALAGAAFTPGAYKCAVSMAGIGDLEEFVRWKKKKFGDDSDVFAHFVRAIGDPDKDQAAIREVSPAFHVDAIRIPILLIHGDKDESVPYSQSENMQKVLEKSGRKTELIRLKNEGHGGFEDETSKVMLSAVGAFLWENLGKGHGVSEPPVKYVFVK